VSFNILKFLSYNNNYILIQSFPPSVIKTIVIQNELIDEVEKDEPVKKKAKGNRNPDVDTS